MKEKKMLFYTHGGSGNHGCEALVRSSIKILQQKPVLFSSKVEEDQKYKMDMLANLHSSDTSSFSFWRKLSPAYLIYAFRYHFVTCYASDFSAAAAPVLRRHRACVALSIGGDNYCYDGMIPWLIEQNAFFNKRHIPTVLWGCSIEPELLRDSKIQADLKSYALITARESITYQALLDAGIDRNTHLFPDPAFQLDRVELPLPKGLAEGNTVGINVSPLIIDNETGNGITIQNYQALIQYILDKTDMQVAFIPHVVWESNDDRKPLSVLYEMFKDTGRVELTHGQYCIYRTLMQMKNRLLRR